MPPFHPEPRMLAPRDRHGSASYPDRETWPHEYVVVNRDGQQELLAAFCERISRGEGVECQFFHQRRKYLFLGDYKYWTMTECSDIDLDDDAVLNRALLYRDRRDFAIRKGDTGKRET